MPNLDSEPQLNIEIMKIYDSIKEIGHFDYGFANCNYGFSYDNLKKLNTDFVKHVDAFLKNGMSAVNNKSGKIVFTAPNTHLRVCVGSL